MAPLLSTFPTELLDHICSYITSPRDLLSFAFCERRLSTIIIPSHIQFRHLVCHLSNQSLFRKLLEHPALTSRFVLLDLGPRSEGLIWPTSLLDELSFEWPPLQKGGETKVLDEVSKKLVPSLQCLVGLTTFRCDLHAIGMAERVFTTLQQSCPMINTLEVEWSSYSGMDLHRSTLWNFSNLTRFSCSYWGNFFDREHTKQPFKMVTERCPHLEELLFTHTSELNIIELAERGRWPYLKSLCLGGLGDSATVTSPTPILTDFFNAQPRLERLYVNSSDPVSVNDLPPLRALHLGLGAKLDKKRSFPVATQLEYLAIDFSCDFDGYLHFLKLRPPLRALVVAPHQIWKFSDFVETFVHFVPNLERFHWNHQIAHSCTHNHDVAAICKILTHLPRLTHLSNVLEIKAQSSEHGFVRELSRVLARLANAAPSLQCLDMASTDTFHDRRWLVIERKRGGRYGGFRWLLKQEFKSMGIAVDDWGGFYFGSGRGSMYFS